MTLAEFKMTRGCDLDMCTASTPPTQLGSNAKRESDSPLGDHRIGVIKMT